jgi:hypothetical protein
MLDRTKYLAVCGTLLMLLAGIAGCWVGMQIKPTPVYIYLDYETVNNTSSMRKTFKESGIELSAEQEKAFQENIKPRRK